MLALLLHLAHDLAKGTYVSLTRAGPWALATWSRSSSSPTGLAVARVRTTSCSTSRPSSSKRRSVLLQQTCAWLWLALRWALWEALRHPLSKQNVITACLLTRQNGRPEGLPRLARMAH